MPLYELYRLTRERLGQESNGTRAADHSSSPDNDFCELVWENGQISSQSQSSRVRKSPSSRSLPSYCMPSNSPRARDKDVGFGTNMEKFRDFDSELNETPISVSSREMDLSQGEDMIPWMDYTMDGSLQHEYGSDFLNEISGVTENDLPTSINFTLLDKGSNVNQVIRDSQKNSTEQRNVSKGYLTERFEAAKPEASTSQLYPPSSHQCQTSFVSVRSRAFDASHATENNNTRNENQDAPYGEISQILPSSNNFSSLKVQKQDTVMPSNGSTIMNFSHFARPAAVMKANLQNIGLRSRLSSPKLDSLDIKGKGVAATSSNPNESTLVDSSGKCPKEPTMHCEQIVEQSKADLKSLQPKSLEQNVVLSKQSEHASKESPIKIDQTSSHVVGEIGAKVQKISEKSVEPAVASSSVCSGNGADGTSEDPNQNLKRKSRDTEDSECHSEDVEEESVGVKKAAAGRGSTGSKRSRAAEVHNLSERRRRDRINEKMRALQELIPNCNKVDKASMLDEAIEYLKTLQLQVQMMSMGAGLYMPPMMLPAGMQHMHATHMAAFAPMGVGMHHMGFGMGYGMGMPDMNGGSSRFPMIQVPQMQGTHIPVTHMSGPAALHAMPRSNAPGFGLPGQGLPMPMPRAPAFPFSGAPLMNPSALGLHASGPAGVVETMDKASASNLKDPMTNVDPQVKQSTGGHDSTSRMPTQCETTVGLEQSTLVRSSGHASEANGGGAVNHGKEDKLVNGYD